MKMTKQEYESKPAAYREFRGQTPYLLYMDPDTSATVWGPVEITDASRPAVNEWPYPWINKHYNPGHPEWLETSQETFDNQLGCVPPARHKAGAFAVGECSRHDRYCDPLHAIFVEYAGRYFCRLGNLHDFDPVSYQKEIRDQFGRSNF